MFIFFPSYFHSFFLRHWVTTTHYPKICRYFCNFEFLLVCNCVFLLKITFAFLVHYYHSRSNYCIRTVLRRKWRLFRLCCSVDYLMALFSYDLCIIITGYYWKRVIWASTILRLVLCKNCSYQTWCGTWAIVL